MYLDDPFETDFEYPGYLHLPISIAPNASATLVIGLGGGSVVKRMWRDYPWMRVDVVEIDRGVVDVAREYFAVPEDERLRIFVDDGRRFLSSSNDVYDIVIVDAFDDDHMPRPLTTEEFLYDIRAHLTPEGVVAYNVIGALYGPHSKPFRSFYRTLANVWRRVWVFPIAFSEDVTDKTRNVVVVATDADVTTDELLERIASRADGLITVPKFERYGEDLYRGKIRSGDVPLIVDERKPRRR